MIRQRPEGRWEFRLRLGKGETFVRYARSRPQLLQIVHDERAKNGGTLRADSKLRIGEYLTDWLASDIKPNRKATTLAAYEYIANNHIIPRIGTHRLDQIDARTIDSLYAKLRETGASTAILQKVHAVLHCSLSAATRKRLVNSNPADQVVPPRHTAKPMHFLTPQEVRRLMSAAKSDRLEALYVLALTTGMRQGELFALRWDDVDFRNRRVAVRRSLQEVGACLAVVEPKTTASKRVLDLDTNTMSALIRRRELSWQEAADRARRNDDPKLSMRRKRKGLDVECPWVFAGEDGKLPRKRNVRRRSFYPLLERAELPRIRFHDLRHTAATLMLAAGVHPKVVADRLGHATVRITLDRYTHVLPGMGREAADLVARLLGEGPEAEVKA